MLELDPIVLRDERVELRPLRAADAEALCAAAAEGRDSYGFTPVPDELEGAREYIERAFDQQADGERLPFVIEWQGRVVGSTSYYDIQQWRWPRGSALQREDRPDVVEIGYTWLAASAQGTDCNARAKRLLLTHAFESWQVHRVSLRTDVRNERSRRAIERLGARLDGVLRAHRPGSDGTVRDSAYYSILRAEWPELKARLEARIRGALAP